MQTWLYMLIAKFYKNINFVKYKMLIYIMIIHQVQHKHFSY